MSRVEILESKLSSLQKKLKATQEMLSKSEKRANTLEKEQIQGSKTGNFVVFHQLLGHPHCSEHGAMLCMNKERTIWRCDTCHIGADTSKILVYARKEMDVTLIFDDKELVNTIKSSKFKEALKMVNVT